MTREDLTKLSLADLKLVAKNIGLKGFGSYNKKATAIAKIEAEMDELGAEEVPDLEVEVIEPKVEQQVITPTTNSRKRIKDFPRKKVSISARDEDIKEYVFSVNEYLATIEMEKEVNLPIPVIDFIKSLVTIKFEKDANGYSKTREVNKFFVNYV